MNEKAKKSLPGDPHPLGERLEEVVEAVGSRAQAAALAGVTTQQLRNVISGRNAPSFIPIAKLAEATGYRLEWIFSGTEPKKTSRSKLLVTLPEQMLSIPTDPGAENELINQVFDALAPVYARAGRHLDPVEDLFFLDDCKMAIINELKKEDWGRGVRLLARAQALALDQTGHAQAPLKVPKR